MALAVARALREGEILVVEAGPGTGKSLAYLAPALAWRRAGGERVVVATRTLNLQEQLLKKDLPLLRRLAGVPLRAVEARGWSNYVCLRRLETLPRSGDLSPAEGEALERLNRALEEGTPGVRQELDTPPELWSRVAAEPTACARSRCPWYSRCYFFRQRRELERADLVVTNHALLLSDVAMRREGGPGVLPGDLSCIILDEAHHLEAAATEHLARQVRTETLGRLLGQLYRPSAQTLEQGGFLAVLREAVAGARLDAALRRELLNTLDSGLLAALPGVEEGAQELAAHLQALCAGQDRRPLSGEGLSSPEGEEVRRAGLRLAERLASCAEALAELCSRLERTGGWPGSEGLEMEISGFAQRLEGMRGDLEFCLFPEDPAWVYFAEAGPEGTGLCAAPLEVGPLLEQHLFREARAAVLTSATLAVGGRLEPFQERVGLDRLAHRVRRLCLPSPFDYRSQALLGIAADLPEPGHPRFPEALAGPVADLAAELGGGVFLLVTSWSLLRRLEALLRPALRERKVELLAQGQAPRGALLARFCSPGRWLLLGTDSFWEEVDVPGQALRCVVLARLPFRVPTDPIHAARTRRLEEQGRNPFFHYHLPLAVTRFRQGFGRLIRSAADRGVVLVADPRIRTRSYGRAFLESLPPCHLVEGPLEELVGASLAWLRTPSRPG